MGFWRHLLAQTFAGGVQAAQGLHCLRYPPSVLFPPGSEAAMEAAGSLAPVYPEVFSGRMVPRLGEELQSGRGGGGKGMTSGVGVKP